MNHETGTSAVGVVAVSTPYDPVSCSTSADCPLQYSCSQSLCKKACSTTPGCFDDEACIDGFCEFVENRQRPVVVHRFNNIAGPISHAQATLKDKDDLDGTTSVFRTANDPRVAFIRSMGGHCTPFTQGCAHGYQLEGLFSGNPGGRFLVMITALDRSPRLYLSDTAGTPTSFDLLVEDAPETSTTRLADRRLLEGFDIHCPNHSDTEETLEDRICWIVFDQFDDVSLSDSDDDEEMTPTGRHIECALRFGYNISARDHFRIIGCSNPTQSIGTTGNGASGSAYFASLSDYGTGVPSSQLQGRRWVLGYGVEAPHLQGASNSRMRLWNFGSATLVGQSPQARIFDSSDADSASKWYAIDANSCSAMTNIDKTFSYFGGSSVEYCEDCQRFLVARWGTNRAPDAPLNVCY